MLVILTSNLKIIVEGSEMANEDYIFNRPYFEKVAKKNTTEISGLPF